MMKQVSILVFLDAGLEAKYAVNISWWFIGFQSLFFWMPVWKVPARNRFLDIKPFQSLFFWMPVWKNLSFFHKIGISRFQSLFFWMPVWKIGVGFPLHTVIGVSILVFLDAGLEVPFDFPFDSE